MLILIGLVVARDSRREGSRDRSPEARDVKGAMLGSGVVCSGGFVQEAHVYLYHRSLPSYRKSPRWLLWREDARASHGDCPVAYFRLDRALGAEPSQ